MHATLQERASPGVLAADQAAVGDGDCEHDGSVVGLGIDIGVPALIHNSSEGVASGSGTSNQSRLSTASKTKKPAKKAKMLIRNGAGKFTARPKVIPEAAEMDQNGQGSRESAVDEEEKSTQRSQDVSTNIPRHISGSMHHLDQSQELIPLSYNLFLARYSMEGLHRSVIQTTARV